MREPKDIKIGKFTLAEILERHLHWIKEDVEGWKDMRADLSHADLRGADLSYACLSHANLRGADLRYACLSHADLSYACLSHANLRYACLSRADLSDADLRGADLSYANLSDANLYGAKGNLIEYRKGKILTKDIIGYKKCSRNEIVTLKIPRGSIVFSINGNKCRTNQAEVIAIDGGNRAFSLYKYMYYYVGDKITVYDFNCEYNVECAEGIHFFMTREEAENYNY